MNKISVRWFTDIDDRQIYSVQHAMNTMKQHTKVINSTGQLKSVKLYRISTTSYILEAVNSSDKVYVYIMYLEQRVDRTKRGTGVKPILYRMTVRVYKGLHDYRALNYGITDLLSL